MTSGHGWSIHMLTMTTIYPSLTKTVLVNTCCIHVIKHFHSQNYSGFKINLRNNLHTHVGEIKAGSHWYIYLSVGVPIIVKQFLHLQGQAWCLRTFFYIMSFQKYGVIAERMISWVIFLDSNIALPLTYYLSYQKSVSLPK